MKILVTGGAGFLGSHIVLRHLAAGDDVLCVDDFSTAMGSPFIRPSPHFQRMLAYAGRFMLMRSDISSHSMLAELADWGGDVIYNFACPASPPRYQATPVETMMTCVAGTHNMLQVALRTGAVVVHASTSEVYGDPDVNPQGESYRGRVNPYGPRACYDEGKRAAEALCYDFRHKHGVDARLVRIFNTYGPHMDPHDGRVVSNLIRQALRGEDLTVYGDGSQTRSFCYVDDLVSGITALGALPSNPGTPINVGNPDEFTVLDLAREVRARLGGRIVFRDLPVDDPTQRRPDISLAKQLLGWEPRITLQEGLDRTIEYFRGVIEQWSMAPA